MTVAAPCASPSRSCRASQSGDIPPSLPERWSTTGRGVEQQRGPAPPSRRRCQQARTRAGSAGAARYGPCTSRPQDVRAHSGQPWPWPRPALAETCTSAKSARPGCAQMLRHCHAAERLASASPAQAVMACAPRRTICVSTPQSRQERLLAAAAPQGNDTGRGELQARLQHGAGRAPRLHAVTLGGANCRLSLHPTGRAKHAGPPHNILRRLPQGGRFDGGDMCGPDLRKAQRIAATGKHVPHVPLRRASPVCRPCATRRNRCMARPRPAGRAGARLRETLRLRPGPAPAPHGHASGWAAAVATVPRAVFCE